MDGQTVKYGLKKTYRWIRLSWVLGYYGWAYSQVRSQEDLQVNIRDFHEFLAVMDKQTVKYSLKKTYRWILETFMSSGTLWMGGQSSTDSWRPTGEYQRLSWVLGHYGWTDCQVRPQEELQVNIRLSWVLGHYGWANSQVRPKEDLQVNIRDFHEFLAIYGWADRQVRPQKDIQVNIRDFHEFLVIMDELTVKYGLKKTYRWLSETFRSSWSLWMSWQSSTASRRPTGEYQIFIMDGQTASTA